MKEKLTLLDHTFDWHYVVFGQILYVHTKHTDLHLKRHHFKIEIEHFIIFFF